MVFTCYMIFSSLSSDIYLTVRSILWLLIYSAEGVPEPISLLEPEQLTPGITNTTNAVIARLKDFHDLLRNPPQVNFSTCQFIIFFTFRQEMKNFISRQGQKLSENNF